VVVVVVVTMAGLWLGLGVVGVGRVEVSEGCVHQRAFHRSAQVDPSALGYRQWCANTVQSQRREIELNPNCTPNATCCRDRVVTLHCPNPGLPTAEQPPAQLPH